MFNPLEELLLSFLSDDGSIEGVTGLSLIAGD
jgi:hypothetical protein